jgi:hypothetical protein
MAYGTGGAAQLAFAKEGTANTRETPDHWVEFVQEGVKLKSSRIDSKGLRAGRRVNHGWAAGNTSIEGPISIELVAQSVGELLELCFGGLATAGAGPYTHTLTPGNLATGTFQIGRPDSGGTVRPFDYIGTMVNSWALSFDATGDGSMIGFQVDLLGREETTGETLATPSYPTVTRFTSVQASLTIAGSAYCVDSGTVTGNNNLDMTHKACAADAGKPTIRESGQREYGGTLVADFQDLTAYNRFVNGTEAALVVTISAGDSASLVITMNVRFDGDTPNVSGPEVLKQSLPFICTGTTDALAITAVLTNSDSTA